MSLKDKVIVITGGSSGIGAQTANLALKQGAKVVIGARDEVKLRNVYESSPNPANMAYQVTDVTKKADVDKLINFADDKFGAVDVLYNNAGVMPQGPLKEGKVDAWQTAFNVNVSGVLNGIASAVPVMEKQGHGQILATDSVAGHKVSQNSVVYNGTKHAVRAIMEGLRQEEHGKNLKTGIVSPGFVDTNLFSTVGSEERRQKLLQNLKQKNRSLNAKDIARSVVFMMDQPENVDINEIYVRPTAQDN